MHEPVILPVIFFLLVVLMIYLWTSQRNLIKNRTLTPSDYLWKLKCITGKSEYEIFHIAAEEKGRPRYQVERHFKRYLEDQTLPDYVKEFLEDGKEHINAYSPKGINFLNKKLLIFYSFLTLVMIGGSFFICLYIFPRIARFDNLPRGVIANVIKTHPRYARPFINRAISFGLKGQVERACYDLKLACESGYCEDYKLKKREGVCR
ncbi:MAG: hypothetical protein PVI38_04035 [Desulfobacterales bacterium]|jgi:hypothetical protein